jgi:hypothetical protein
MGGSGSSPGVWSAGVTVSEDRSLESELRGRFGRSPPELGISVTDLLGPRRAFWRRFGGAAPVDEERLERMERGRSWHHQLPTHLPTEGRFEVRVRREGVIGRIDLLSDVPVEVKTGNAVGAESIAAERPEHVEQLAIYCLLTDRSEGRVVYLAPGNEGQVGIAALDMVFGSLDRIRSAVRSRRGSMLEAMRTVRPDELPACRWFGRGCEFQSAKVCDCTGTEPMPPSDLIDELTRVTPRPDVEARWKDGLGRAAPPAETPSLLRFRDLIYPRRTYFVSTAPAPAGVAPARPPVPLTPDLYERLLGTIEGGVPGEVALLPSVAPGPEEDVVGFRGRPILVRTSRAWSRVDPRTAVARLPQYALDLGYRCASTGTSEGVVVLAFERAETDTDRLQVLRYQFHDPGAFAAQWDVEATRLREAIAAHDPQRLSPCPGWMYEDCPYRGECGCGPEPGRSQR